MFHPFLYAIRYFSCKFYIWNRGIVSFWTILSTCEKVVRLVSVCAATAILLSAPIFVATLKWSAVVILYPLLSYLSMLQTTNGRTYGLDVMQLSSTPLRYLDVTPHSKYLKHSICFIIVWLPNTTYQHFQYFFGSCPQLKLFRITGK